MVRPILSTEFASGGHVDLIDKLSMVHVGYKWINRTTFCVLRPLASKRAAEVAWS